MLRVGRIDAIRASIFPVISISFFHAACTHPVNELFSPTSKITPLRKFSLVSFRAAKSRLEIFREVSRTCLSLRTSVLHRSTKLVSGEGQTLRGRSRFVLLTDFDSGGGIVRMKRCGQKTSRETKDRKLKVGARRS